MRPIAIEVIAAVQLAEKIRRKNPAYSVRWNPDIPQWPGEPYGMFEIVANGKVHYRRRTAKGIDELIEGGQ